MAAETAELDKPDAIPDEKDQADEALDQASGLPPTEAPKPRRKKPTGSKVDEQAAEAEEQRKAVEERAREQEIEDARKELDKLDPQTKPKRWMIGKTPEEGGTEKQYSIYVQDKLPWMPRQQFFSLVARTFSQAIKASGGNVAGMGDIFGDESGGSLMDRGRRLTQRDLTDASQFMTLAFELIGYSADFLIDCYVILLDVPRTEREWARMRFSEPWDPKKEKYGLRDEQHEEIIQTFIDQNYEEIRRFFVVTMPAMGRRIALHEKARDRSTIEGHESRSAQ
jgi:hypothetical protein